MRNTASKPSLTEACVKREDERHALRLKHLKALAPQLHLLQAFVPGLEARGITLWPDYIELDNSRPRKPAVRLLSRIFDSGNRQLYQALLDLGFQEEERRDHKSFAAALLRHGALRISMHVDSPVVASAPPPAAEEGRGA